MRKLVHVISVDSENNNEFSRFIQAFDFGEIWHHNQYSSYSGFAAWHVAGIFFLLVPSLLGYSDYPIQQPVQLDRCLLFLLCGKKSLISKCFGFQGFLHGAQDFPPSCSHFYPLHIFGAGAWKLTIVVYPFACPPKNESISYGRSDSEENSESQAFFCSVKKLTRTFHGTGIFTYIYLHFP